MSSVRLRAFSEFVALERWHRLLNHRRPSRTVPVHLKFEIIFIYIFLLLLLIKKISFFHCHILCNVLNASNDDRLKLPKLMSEVEQHVSVF
jgi:hypothetical protein